jgi:hypothetical protein
MVYFAQHPGGSVKIGCTGNLEARLDQLKAHYGAELALLATLPGNRSVEAEIHERFAHLRFGRTEQFRPGAELMEFIGKPLLVDANPDAVEATPPLPGIPKAVRLDPDLYAKARIIALRRGIQIGEYLGGLLGSPIDRDYQRVLRELADEEAGK